eukprot:6213779-Pleurochrysis_carterae.AAC.2
MYPTHRYGDTSTRRVSCDHNKQAACKGQYTSAASSEFTRPRTAFVNWLQAAEEIRSVRRGFVSIASVTARV